MSGLQKVLCTHVSQKQPNIGFAMQEGGEAPPHPHQVCWIEVQNGDRRLLAGGGKSALSHDAPEHLREPQVAQCEVVSCLHEISIACSTLARASRTGTLDSFGAPANTCHGTAPEHPQPSHGPTFVCETRRPPCTARLGGHGAFLETHAERKRSFPRTLRTVFRTMITPFSGS